MHPFFIAGSGALAAAGTIAYGAVYLEKQFAGQILHANWLISLMIWLPELDSN
jgi:hypothetical protein